MSTARFSPQAILFDLAGTLLDTLADLVTASNLMLAELGRPTRTQAQIHSFVGKGFVNLVGRCLAEDFTPASEAELTVALEIFCRHYTRVNGQITRPYPGVPELLARLAARKLKMALVTNKATSFTLPLLQQFDLARYFSVLVCGDTLPMRNPTPPSSTTPAPVSGSNRLMR